MQVRWEVEDGYVTGARPQFTEVPDEELEECETDEEREEVIHGYVQEDFEQRITFSILSKL